MTVLVTGASGLVGTALVRRLAADPGWRVRAASRTRPTRLPDGVEWVPSPDLGPDADWNTQLRGVRVVVHLAAHVHVTAAPGRASDEAFQRVNVQGSGQLARQAAALGVHRFLYLSSVKVHGDTGHVDEDSPRAPRDAYGASKRDAEDALRTIADATGLDVVVIRPPLVYGPGVSANLHALIAAVERGWPLPFASIANRRSLVGVDNLVDLIAVCVDHPAACAGAFLVSDDDDVSTPELVRRLARALGRPARLWPCPVWALRLSAALLGRTAAVARLTGSLSVDITRARRVLGWSPPVPMEEGLRRMAGAR